MTVKEFEEKLQYDKDLFLHMPIREREANIDICRVAIKNDSSNIALLSRKFWRKNPQLLKEVVADDIFSLEYVDKRIQKKFSNIIVDALVTSTDLLKLKRTIRDEKKLNMPYYTFGSSFKFVYAIEYLDESIIHNYSYLIRLFEAATDKESFLFHAIDSVARNMIINRNKEENTGNSWQSKTKSKIIKEDNVILSSPTGSGKTRVFMDWALKKKEKKIYITSPIIALSNQRYRELIEQGYKVGLETGDTKIVPDDCDIICCTQEIYTNKYIREINATLIMDEFHYIFENPDRARAYIDALQGSKAKNVLLCSATLGDMQNLKSYLERVSKREFCLIDNRQRLTELSYEGQICDDELENALIVAFSNSNIDIIIDRMINERSELDKWKSEIPLIDNPRYKYIVDIARRFRYRRTIIGGIFSFLWNRKIYWYYASKAKRIYRMVL